MPNQKKLNNHSHPAFSAVVLSLVLLLVLFLSAVSFFFVSPSSFKSSILSPLASFFLSGGARVEGTMRFLSTIFFGEEIDETNNLVWNLSLYYYPTDDEIRISAPGLLQQGATGQWNKTALSESDSNKDNKYYVTEWGTLALYDSDDDDDITIWYPDEQVYGNAFIAPVGAVVSGAGGETSAVTLNPINVGSAKLASEVRGQETA